MLLFPYRLTKHYNAEEKQVNGNSYIFIGGNLLPRFFHFAAPMNIVKDQDGLIVEILQQELEIVQGWFLSMISINKHQVKLLLALQ